VIGFLLLAAFAVLFPLVGVTGAVGYAQEAVEYVRGLGWWTLPLYVLVAGVAVGFALVPSHLTSLLAGAVYGFAAGGVVALGAVAVGASIGFVASRFLARDVVRGVIDRVSWGRLLASEMIDASEVRAVLATTLTRLPPQVPFALGNVIAASCRIRGRVFLAGTLLGMAPRVLLVVWVGASLSEWQPGAPVPGAVWLSLGAAVVGFGGLAAWSIFLLRRYKADRGPRDAAPEVPSA